MKSRFAECLTLVLKHEGGYSEHPDDKGGATLNGVTQTTYDRWRALKGKPLQHVRHMQPEERDAIYMANYWQAGKCDQMPAPLDYLHFDGCVNHGIKQASKFLQRALGVEDDGSIGPQTLAAVRQDDAAGSIEAVCGSILAQRECFYKDLAERKPSQNKFIKGWLNRISDVRKEIEA
jgi:lysozyme family protein